LSFIIFYFKYYGKTGLKEFLVFCMRLWCRAILR